MSQYFIAWKLLKRGSSHVYSEGWCMRNAHPIRIQSLIERVQKEAMEAHEEAGHPDPDPVFMLTALNKI